MGNSPSTSLLTVLSLYTSLRRSGSSERQAQEKLRGLALQLSAGDRKELLKVINDWEAKQGKKSDSHLIKKQIQGPGDAESIPLQTRAQEICGWILCPFHHNQVSND